MLTGIYKTEVVVRTATNVVKVIYYGIFTVQNKVKTRFPAMFISFKEVIWIKC
jgi:hypothetical protein